MNPKALRVLALLLVAFAASATFMFSQERSCEKLESTSAKSECLEQKLQISEAEMNRAFEHALSAYLPGNVTEKDLPTLPKKDAEIFRQEDRLTLRALRESQVKWIAFRESSCTAVEHMSQGATITAEAVPACKLNLTQQRTAWLNSYFNNQQQ